MRAACDSLIGLLAITVSGGYGQRTINKHKDALGAEWNSLCVGRGGEGEREGFWPHDLSFMLASGWLQVNWSKVPTAEERQG